MFNVIHTSETTFLDEIKYIHAICQTQLFFLYFFPQLKPRDIVGVGTSVLKNQQFFSEHIIKLSKYFIINDN